MDEYLQTIRLGAATITLINVGYLRAEFVEYEPPSRIPMQCVLIQLSETCALVDATLHDLPADSPYAIPGYQPPPGLLVRLAELGVQPDAIAHVVITHAHFDHFNGTTAANGGEYLPCFPQARYYIGRADFEDAEMQTALTDASSLAGRTLAVLQRAGQLALVSGDLSLAQGLDILAAPGESPGHQIVRVSSESQTLYCVGDLYHFASEVEHDDTMPVWADAAAMGESRRKLTAAALAENALITATHVSGFGRLQPSADKLVWRSA